MPMRRAAFGLSRKYLSFLKKPALSTTLAHKSNANFEAPRSTMGHEMAVMFHRHGLLVFRDPLLYIGRIFILLLFMCFEGWMFWEARARTQEMVLSRVMLVWYVIV